VIEFNREASLDDLKLNNYKLLQPLKGYRFSIDSLLLAHFARVSKRTSLVDLGTGSGVISIILAAKNPSVKITAIEVQEELAGLARQNVEMNDLKDRIRVIKADWRKIRKLFAPESFNTAISNPPFRLPGTGRINPLSQKAIARFELKGGLGDLLSAASFLLKSRGHFFITHIPERMPEIFSAMQRRRLTPKTIRLVHPNKEEEARHVLIDAVKDGKPGCRIQKPLFIYNEDNDYTSEASVILGE